MSGRQRSSATAQCHDLLCLATRAHPPVLPAHPPTLSVDSSGRAVAQSMTVLTPTSAAGREEGSVRSACTVVAPQSRRKSAGLSRGRTMQRTCSAEVEKGTRGGAAEGARREAPGCGGHARHLLPAHAAARCGALDCTRQLPRTADREWRCCNDGCTLQQRCCSNQQVLQLHHPLRPTACHPAPHNPHPAHAARPGGPACRWRPPPGWSSWARGCRRLRAWRPLPLLHRLAARTAARLCGSGGGRRAASSRAAGPGAHDEPRRWAYTLLHDAVHNSAQKHARRCCSNSGQPRRRRPAQAACCTTGAPWRGASDLCKPPRCQSSAPQRSSRPQRSPRSAPNAVRAAARCCTSRAAPDGTCAAWRLHGPATDGAADSRAAIVESAAASV